MTRDYWWALATLIIAIALAFILLSTAKDDSHSAVAALPPLPKCLDSKARDTIERLTDRAVDQGYQRHVSHLFDVLMGNPNREQFDRARVGMQNGIKGYLLAQEHIDAWTPPSARYEVLPWIIILLCALAVLAFLGWLGYDNWAPLQ